MCLTQTDTNYNKIEQFRGGGPSRKPNQFLMSANRLVHFGKRTLGSLWTVTVYNSLLGTVWVGRELLPGTVPVHPDEDGCLVKDTGLLNHQT